VLVTRLHGATPQASFNVLDPIDVYRHHASYTHFDSRLKLSFYTIFDPERDPNCWNCVGGGGKILLGVAPCGVLPCNQVSKQLAWAL
jgi:hypothetical protein